MNKRKLRNKIEKKLEELLKVIEKIGNHDIHSDDPEMWDADYYYDLVVQLEKALTLLKDKRDFKKLDDFGDPLILEEGICSLIDEYTSEEEDDDQE